MSHSLNKCSASKDPKMTHYINISASFHARNHFVRAGVHCVQMLNKLIKKHIKTRLYKALHLLEQSVKSAPGIETGDTLLSLLNTDVMLSKPLCFSSISRTFKEPRWGPDRNNTAEGSIRPDTGASEASIGQFAQTCTVHLRDLDRSLCPRQAIPLLTVGVKGRGAINTWRMETQR